ncbi:MAG TPA: hypothetical protein VKU85_13715 [bacterium]|nr:hypothetical protein [bacterium]
MRPSTRAAGIADVPPVFYRAELLGDDVQQTIDDFDEDWNR